MRLISAGSLVRAQSGPFFTGFRPFLAFNSVILNSNPLDDIAHSSDIETVIKNGVACHRAYSRCGGHRLGRRSSGSGDLRSYFARKISAALQPSRHHAGHHLHFLRRRVRFQNTRRQSMPCKTVTNDDTTFKPASELSKICLEQCGVSPDKDTVAYCRIGEHSSHTWFVLTCLLGLNVRSGPFNRLLFFTR